MDIWTIKKGRFFEHPVFVIYQKFFGLVKIQRLISTHLSVVKGRVKKKVWNFPYFPRLVKKKKHGLKIIFKQ